MRRHFGIIAAIILILLVIIALSAAGNVELDKPAETEASPNRSSYNTGPTGTRALYQLLEESGTPIARWREDYKQLQDKARNATMVLVGPYQFNLFVSEEETHLLRDWVYKGGRLLIVSRAPRGQFKDSLIHSEFRENLDKWNWPAEKAEKLIDPQSDSLLVQPTELTRNVRNLALSEFATRLKFYPDLEPVPSKAEEAEDSAPTASPSASPSPSPTAEAKPPAVKEDESSETVTVLKEEEEDYVETMYAPVIHLGEKNGAILADFTYGEGRIVFLSDPFVIANNGINRGGNLTLVLNLVRSLGEGGRRFLFDEFHHGYRATSNPLFDYFRGTPFFWLLAQGAVLAALLLFTFGKRFARPLPLVVPDRHSPLEFVSSMANLQQAAEARDLALENIYPRFKAKLCRRLGLSSRASSAEIVAAAQNRHLNISSDKLQYLIKTCEAALSDGRTAERLDDETLIKLIATMRLLVNEPERMKRAPAPSQK